MATCGGGQPAELLAPGEIHAWLVDLDTLPRAGDRFLGPAERDRAASYVRARDGARFATSRAWLRTILSRYLAADPAGLQLAAGSKGAPALAGEHTGTVHFSLSRSNGRAVVAVSRSPVGADVELISVRPFLADLVASRFGSAEADCIAGGCGGSALRGFYRHWTAKEAYLKATGRGLASLRTTELACGARPAIRSAGRPAGDWTVSPLEIGPDCVASIVGCGPVAGCRLACQ